MTDSNASEGARTGLQWSVYVVPPIPVEDPPNSDLRFSPTSITLIHSANEAVVVDAPLTESATNALADWIQATIPHKRLTHVYLTHGHGDHFFGLPILQKRFPGVKAVFTTGALEHARDQVEPASFDAFWKSRFGNALPPRDAIVASLENNVVVLADDGRNEILLEGGRHALRAIPVGHSDTYASTVLHVPELDLVIAGDVVYGRYYQYLAESTTPELRTEWVTALEQVEQLKPKFVVASHRGAEEGFEAAERLRQTRAYLEAWGEEASRTKSADELESAIQKRFPDRQGNLILKISTQAQFNTQSS